MLESQATYISDALSIMDRRRLASVQVRPSAQQKYNADIVKQLAGTV